MPLHFFHHTSREKFTHTILNTSKTALEHFSAVLEFRHFLIETVRGIGSTIINNQTFSQQSLYLDKTWKDYLTENTSNLLYKKITNSNRPTPSRLERKSHFIHNVNSSNARRAGNAHLWTKQRQQQQWITGDNILQTNLGSKSAAP